MMPEPEPRKEQEAAGGVPEPREKRVFGFAPGLALLAAGGLPGGKFIQPAVAIPAAWMPALLSLVVVVACLYILLSKSQRGKPGYSEATRRFATGTIGFVLGYWLR